MKSLVRPDGEDVFEVLFLTQTAVVPAGTFADCLEILENRDDSRGVGRVSLASTLRYLPGPHPIDSDQQHWSHADSLNPVSTKAGQGHYNTSEPSGVSALG